MIVRSILIQPAENQQVAARNFMIETKQPLFWNQLQGFEDLGRPVKGVGRGLSSMVAVGVELTASNWTCIGFYQ